jgi:hypothetical protein
VSALCKELPVLRGLPLQCNAHRNGLSHVEQQGKQEGQQCRRLLNCSAA